MLLKTEAPGRSAIKGVVLVHLREHLAHEGALDAVRARLAREWATALDPIVYATDWIDLRAYAAVCAALEQHRSLAYVFETLHTVTRTRSVARVQPILGGIARIFGLSPQALLSRANLVNQATLRSVDAQWTPRGATEGVLTLRCESECDPSAPWSLVSEAMMHGWCGTFQTGFDVCAVEGRATPIGARGNAVDLHFQW